MIELRVVVLNDQAEALARVLPEHMAALMAETAAEGASPERIDDLTKSRAVLGDVLTRVTRELRALAKLRARDKSRAYGGSGAA